MNRRFMMCIRWLEAGRPQREIADKLGMSSKTISAIKRGETSPRRPGRRSVLTDEHLSFIETNTLADATLSDGRMAEIVTDWSDDEDKRLLELYAAHGDRWQQIASHLGRDPRMVKKRFKMLDQIEKNGLYRAYVRLPPIDELLETI